MQENTGEGKNMKAPRKGACSNIFQIGLLMHALLRREVRYPATIEKQPWKAPFTRPEYRGKFLHGSDLFQQRWANLYSKTLRELIMQCLMWEPNDRPDPLDLQKSVATGLTAALREATSTGRFDNGQNLPVVSFDNVPLKEGTWLDGPTFISMLV